MSGVNVPPWRSRVYLASSGDSPAENVGTRGLLGRYAVVSAKLISHFIE
jgi:hypothetical protein